MSRETPILVVDLEMTCWGDEDEKVPRMSDSHKKVHGEIIEIGITPYYPERSNAIGVAQSIIVNPPTTTVSAYCTRLTGLTQEAVDGGVPLKAAFAYIVGNYDSGRRVWGAWGRDDRTIGRECSRRLIQSPFGKQYLNIKAMYAAYHNGWGAGLRRACKKMKLPFEGTPHNGKDDSRMAAKLLQAMLPEGGHDVETA